MILFSVGWVKPPAAYPATSLENLTPWWSKAFLTVMGLEWNHSAPMCPRKPPRSRCGLHAKIQQDMLNILIFFYNYVGNAALIPTYLFCVGLFSVGWVRPHAAYPATSLGLAFQLGWVRPHGTPGKIHRTSHTMMEQSLSHCHRNRMKSLRSYVS